MGKLLEIPQAAAGAAAYLMMADHTLDSRCSLSGFGSIAC